MNVYLAYSDSVNLTREEQTEIDEKTKKAREEFSKGFKRGIIFSLAAYSFYSLTTSAVHAADSKVPSVTPQTPGSNNTVNPAPTSKPGFKSLAYGTKGAARAIFGDNGDFYIGLGCALVFIVVGRIMNHD